MDFDLYTLVKAMVLPPGLSAVAGIAGLLIYGVARRPGVVLMAGAAVSAWVLGMPATAAFLAAPLEDAAPFEPAMIAGRDVEAIVVLGGGLYHFAPEYDGDDTVSVTTLERLRYGARLHRETGLPLAVSGGAPKGSARAEAEHMREALVTDFGVPVRWVEAASRNTAENALNTQRAFGLERVVLVTHAVHMPRARRAFEAAGVEVVAAPVGFISGRGSGEAAITDYLPGRNGFLGTRYALYEYFGALWYRWRYG